VPSELASYTPEVLAEMCPRCGKQNARCVGPNGVTKLIPAHSGRLKALGLRWDVKTQTLKER
jgi:hypothetical protein